MQLADCPPKAPKAPYDLCSEKLVQQALKSASRARRCFNTDIRSFTDQFPSTQSL